MPEPRTEPAPTSVDNWCGRCGYLTKPEEDRVQVREGTRIRYDHAGPECPETRARAYNRAARYVR